LPLDLDQSISLITESLIVHSPTSLPQFNLIQTSFFSSDESSKVNVEIVLQRIFFYHLTNTFIPTSSLLVIAEITLFFGEPKTELAMGLSLTVMLVMYTMYQSISESLTKTAYLKMIDFWLLFCLLMPFLIFMIEVYWLLRKVELRTRVWPFHNQQNRFRNRKKIQLFVPSITIVFIISFISFAVIVTFKY